MGKDKWDKVIEYLTHSKRDPEKVLNLLKGCDQNKESNYDVNRASYSLNVIAIITQKQLDPENKDKTLTHIIRQWVRSKDFEQFYNLMRSEAQSKNKEYFKSTDGYFIVGMGFQKKTGLDWKKASNRNVEKIRPKAKVIENIFNKIKKKNRSSRTTVS